MSHILHVITVAQGDCQSVNLKLKLSVLLLYAFVDFKVNVHYFVE